MKVELSIDDGLVPQDTFREAMRHLASGVSIVATGEANDRAAITATSVTSLSVEPPRLLVCVARRSSLAPVLHRYRHFSANFLSASQQHLAERFSRQNGINDADRFASSEWITLISGAPVLANALASIDCAVEDIVDRHTHSIVIGRVLAVRTEGGDAALTHWRGTLRPLHAKT